MNSDKERPLLVPLRGDLDEDLLLALDVALLLLLQDESLLAHLDGELLAGGDLPREEHGGEGALPDQLAEQEVVRALLPALHRDAFAHWK